MARQLRCFVYVEHGSQSGYFVRDDEIRGILTTPDIRFALAMPRLHAIERARRLRELGHTVRITDQFGESHDNKF